MFATGSKSCYPLIRLCYTICRNRKTNPNSGPSEENHYQTVKALELLRLRRSRPTRGGVGVIDEGSVRQWQGGRGKRLSRPNASSSARFDPANVSARQNRSGRGRCWRGRSKPNERVADAPGAPRGGRAVRSPAANSRSRPASQLVAPSVTAASQPEAPNVTEHLNLKLRMTGESQPEAPNDFGESEPQAPNETAKSRT